MDLKTFETEGKLDEERKRRQAEWERVRKPSDPVEAPADVFDNRTLYDKLKEQHEIKKKQFEDQYALKNQIRGVDDEEAMFLNEVDDIKIKCEKLKKMEEKKEIEEYKKALEEKDKLTSGLPKIHVTVQKKEKKQSELLASVVVSKRKISNSDNDSTTTDTKQQKTSPTQQHAAAAAAAASETTSSEEKEPEKVKPVTSTKPINKPIIAILPGVGEYNTNSSSSSEYSSDDDDAGCDRVVNANEYAKETHSLFSNSANSSGAQEIGKV